MRYLDKLLPDYPDEDRYSTWSHLASDERWRAITPRVRLTHSPGFANFGFLEPDERLRIHFAPGSRYAYSGDDIILMQLERGLGLDVGTEPWRRVFYRLGVRKTHMMWRPDFARNLADGWTAEGSVEPHDERSKVRGQFDGHHPRRSCVCSAGAAACASWPTACAPRSRSHTRCASCSAKPA
ncbi:hypothetical protein [Myxococcus sp. Y35]|uniref:hypothetical protein n=1 Tax=Pseudomyxococcus flavus TaxID=3115648 RepID=UPI003CF2000B